MDKAKIIHATEEFVKGLLADEGTGHDWWHAVRVSTAARSIREVEGGDPLVIDLAALLHDVGDRKVIKQENDDYTIAENFLHNQNVDANITDQVMFIIKNMSFSKNLIRKKNNAPIEFQIVQDADRLDAIGAIGIARMFTYGGSHGQLIYDPSYEGRDVQSTEEYNKLAGSSFHHFEEKLVHIRNLLNTKTAQKFAKNRDDFMKLFIKQFLDEWNGKQ